MEVYHFKQKFTNNDIFEDLQRSIIVIFYQVNAHKMSQLFSIEGFTVCQHLKLVSLIWR